MRDLPGQNYLPGLKPGDWRDRRDPSLHRPMVHLTETQHWVLTEIRKSGVGMTDDELLEGARSEHLPLTKGGLTRALNALWSGDVIRISPTGWVAKDETADQEVG